MSKAINECNIWFLAINVHKRLAQIKRKNIEKAEKKYGHEDGKIRKEKHNKHSTINY